MKRKLTIISLAAALTLSAEINSPFADGCLQRGIVLLRNDFPQGAIDQFDIARHSSPTPTQDADIAWGKAIATLREGNIDSARGLLQKYIKAYPATFQTLKARIALADCDFYQGRYREALSAYNAISPSAPDLALADDLIYRTAYCDMMLGNTSRLLPDLPR